MLPPDRHAADHILDKDSQCDRLSFHIHSKPGHKKKKAQAQRQPDKGLFRRPKAPHRNAGKSWDGYRVCVGNVGIDVRSSRRVSLAK
jgi:hypothetical protein